MAPKLTPTQSPCRGGKEDSWWGGQPGHWVGTTFSAFIHHLCAGPGHMLRSVVGTHSHWPEALSSQHCQARRGPRIGGLRRCLSTYFPHGGRGAVSGQGAVRRPEGRKGRVGTGCRASMGQARARGMGRGRVGADAGPPRTRLVGRGGAWCAGWEARGRQAPRKPPGFRPVQGTDAGGLPRQGTALRFPLLGPSVTGRWLQHPAPAPVEVQAGPHGEGESEGGQTCVNSLVGTPQRWEWGQGADGL